jgi:transcriptional regulator with XRE-family HTH domain
MKISLSKNRQILTAADRLQHARQLTNLSRIAIAKKYNISPSSLAKWELGILAFSYKKAKILTQALQNEQIDVTAEWLYEGVGNAAQRRSYYHTTKNDFMDEESFIYNELKNFEDFYKSTLSLKVYDDSCLPIYFPGDVIAGFKRTGEQILTFKGKICLIELESGAVCIRKITNYNISEGTFELETLNPYTEVATHIIKNATLKSAALITFYRRPAY